MDDERKAERPVISDHQRLLLHQLRLLEWQSNRNQQAVEAPLEGAEATPSARVPPVWHLTQDVDLYPWQVDCVERWFDAGRRGTVKVVTGAGKTLLALAIAERLQTSIVPELRMAVVVPTIVLMHQWYDEILQRGNLPTSAVGRLGGGYKQDLSDNRRILIAVLASAHKELPKLVKRAGAGQHLLLVADECHRTGAEEMSRVFTTERAFSLGLSATPERDEDEERHEESGYEESLLGRELGPIVYEFTLADALRLGIVPTFTIHHYGLPLMAIEQGRYDRLSRSISDAQSELRNWSQAARSPEGSFFQWARNVASRNKGELGALAARFIRDVSLRKALLYRMEARTSAVPLLLREEFVVNPDARVILFHESIEEVMNLYVQLQAAGIPAIAEHSEFPGSIREEGLDLFRRGIARVIVSARSLIEGFNVPAADVGLIVASSSSARQRIQTLGRVLRRHRGSSGEEKSSRVYVLYAQGTVEETIYAKLDWDRITGLDRNIYFHWAPGTPPILQEGPPRTPLPGEDEIPAEELTPGCEYPGRYDGAEYSCDTKMNIRDSDGRYARNVAELAEAVLATKGTGGRFRITPKKRYVLVRVFEGEEWITKYVTRLDHSLEYAEESSDTIVLDDGAPDLWATSAHPGDAYPFPGIPIASDSIRYKAKRGGVISKRVKGGEVFARAGAAARDPAQGQDAAVLLRALADLESRGERVSQLLVNRRNHVLYRVGGELRFLGALQVGLEFPE